MLKSLITCSTLFCCWSVLSAQTTIADDPAGPRHKVEFGLTGSIDYCNRYLVNTTGDDLVDRFIEIYNDEDIASPGFSAGLALKIPLTLKSRFITGLRFSRSGYQTKCFDNLQWPSENNNGQWAPNDSAADISIQYIYRSYYLDLPLLFQVFTNAEKHKLFFTGGFSTNFFLKETTTSIWTENGDAEKTTVKNNGDYAFFNITPEISFGQEISLNKSTTLQIGPTFRYGLFPLQDSPIGIHLWSIGLNASCYFH